MSYPPTTKPVCRKEWDDARLEHPDVTKMLESFRWVRCSFTYFSNPSHHYLHSLRAFTAYFWQVCFHALFKGVPQ